MLLWTTRIRGVTSWKQSKMFSGNIRKMFFICFGLVLDGPAVRTIPNPHLPKGQKFRPEEAEGNALESYGLCQCTNVPPQGAGYGFPAQPPCSSCFPLRNEQLGVFPAGSLSPDLLERCRWPTRSCCTAAGGCNIH